MYLPGDDEGNLRRSEAGEAPRQPSPPSDTAALSSVPVDQPLVAPGVKAAAASTLALAVAACGGGGGSGGGGNTGGGGPPVAAVRKPQTDAEAARLKLATLRYNNGVANQLDLLDAQRSLFASQQAFIAAQLARQQAHIALYKALGGGWAAAEAVAPAASAPVSSPQPAPQPASAQP